MNPVGFDTFLKATLLLSALVFIQILIWRLFLPKKQILVLFLLFLGVPGLLIILSFLLPDIFNNVAANLLALSVGVVYVQSFPGIQAISPSLELIFAIKNRTAQGGAELNQVYAEVLSDNLLNERVEDLIRDGLAHKKEGRLQLSRAGLVLAKTFFWYRRVLGLPRGEG